MADEIAQRVGIFIDSDYRIRAGILYTLLQAAGQGHTYLPKEELFSQAAELLKTPVEGMEKHLMDMQMDRRLVVKRMLGVEKEQEEGRDFLAQTAVYASVYYYMELNTARMLHDLNIRGDVPQEEIRLRLDKLQDRKNIRLDPLQAQAAIEAVNSGLLIITGGPGTGKTTIINTIIGYFEEEGMEILLAAPTGRAAKRMTEATGYEAKTIHRLLELNGAPSGSGSSSMRFERNEENPLEGDVLIVDECSMIDIILMNSMMKAVPANMRLILVGDIDQLPSVGAGNVLRDIIDSACFPVIRLTRIFRQALRSRIIYNAHRINAGQMPDLSNGKGTDFFFVEKEEPEEAVAEIVRLVKDKLPRHYGLPSSLIQVLTPMQRGEVGATNLNLVLQEALNPQGEGLRRSGFVFRPGDRVMQIKNNYDKEIFNGDIGEIERGDLTQRVLTVCFEGRRIPYEAAELDELVHAYATTIHKAQGSEYQIVVMPVLMKHFVMLQRNLIYTGITRAKKILVIVGTKKALSYAVKNVTVTKRNTMLRERLNGSGPV